MNAEGRAKGRKGREIEGVGLARVFLTVSHHLQDHRSMSINGAAVALLGIPFRVCGEGAR